MKNPAALNAVSRRVNLSPSAEPCAVRFVAPPFPTIRTCSNEIFSIAFSGSPAISDGLTVPRTRGRGWVAVTFEMVKSVDLGGHRIIRSEEHTSELQSHLNLVCRL